jgi:Putative bacterial sensory transduction regulator
MVNTEISNPITGAELDEMLDIQHAEVIQTVIASLDPNQTAMVSKADGGHIWKFMYGSVEVFVQLTGNTDDDTLTVWSKVMALPVKNQPELLDKLLQMNWANTLESRFAIFDNSIVSMSTRTVAELSPGEMSRAITLVADVADSNDEILQAAHPAAQ